MKTDLIIVAYLVTYAASICAGHVLANQYIKFMHEKIDEKGGGQNPKAERVPALDWSVGGFERILTTTLVIWASPLVPPFVGAWVALKLAANWQMRIARPSNIAEQRNLSGKRLSSLVGSGISLGVAILAGLAINPDAIMVWANPN